MTEPVGSAPENPGILERRGGVDQISRATSVLTTSVQCRFQERLRFRAEFRRGCVDWDKLVPLKEKKNRGSLRREVVLNRTSVFRRPASLGSLLGEVALSLYG